MILFHVEQWEKHLALRGHPLPLAADVCRQRLRKRAGEGITLIEALEGLAAGPWHRFHMPGHKGVLPPPLDGAARMDMTELAQTGNLYTERDGLIRQAERRCARLYGVAAAQFLTGGATQGMFAMLAALTRPGDSVAVDRGCHRSVYAAMAVLGLEPLYLTRERVGPWGVDAALAPFPLPENIACVVLTDPTYYGVRSPDRRWCTVEGRDVPVLVDAAHGAHLPFLPDGRSPLEGAYMAVCSAHKTLPALGQAAFLLLREEADDARLRYMSSVFGTASPSYPVLASMDAAFAALERNGRERWAETAAFADALRAEFPGLLAEDSENSLVLDGARLCLYTGNGYRDALRLERELGVLCEMADNHNIVFILTPNDPPESWAALREGFELLSAGGAEMAASRTPPRPLPERACTLREAMFSPTESVRLAQSAGRVAARPLAPYPPGAPLVAPGERIDKIHIEILTDLCYDEGEEDFRVEVLL